jgi:6-phosphogluconolactonase (cycloisomerase 2 family)
MSKMSKRPISPDPSRRSSVPLISRCVLCGVLGLVGLVPGCSEDELFGPGTGPDAKASTPAGVQRGEITLLFTLSYREAGTTDVTVSFSTNGGATFSRATAAPTSPGTDGLAASEDGVTHTFIWDSSSDVSSGRFENVVVRVSPEAGRSGATGTFVLNNTVFLFASVVGPGSDSRVALHELDLPSGEIRHVRSVDSGGEDPFDIVHRGDFVYVANEGTSDISALLFDGSARTLTPLEGSPFTTGALGSRYLAIGEGRVFVTNTISGTISVFVIEDDGTLTLDGAAGVAAPGCRGLALRGARLYVACESADELRIFDLEDGILVPNAFSPLTVAGLDAPRAITIQGTQLWVAEASSARIHALRILGGGDLAPVAGSPFTTSSTGLEDLRVSGSFLFAGAGTAGNLAILAIDANGALAEIAASPVSAGAPVTGVQAAGGVVVAATSTADALLARLVAADATVSTPNGSPTSTAGEVRRLTITD